MRENDIKEMFQRADTEIRIDTQKKEAALAILGKAAEKTQLSASGKKWSFFQIYFRCMDKTMLGIQSCFGIVILAAVVFMGHYGTERQELLRALVMTAGLLGSLSVTGAGRMFSANLTELSASCYFNARQLLAYQMAAAGGINLMILSVLTVFVGNRWQTGILQTGLYIVVPLVFAQCCGVGVMLTETGRRYPLVQAAAGALGLVFLTIINAVPGIYTRSAMLFWAGAWVAGVCVLVGEIRFLMNGIERGEMLCLN